MMLHLQGSTIQSKTEASQQQNPQTEWFSTPNKNAWWPSQNHGRPELKDED